MKSFKKKFTYFNYFFKTGNLLSEITLFNVNNIELEKKNKITNQALADKAIKKGYDLLIERILLNEDY